MKILTCVAPGEFQYGDISQPDPQAGRAIIKIKRIGICGTDLHAYEGTQPYFSYPRILGHELAGELVQISSNQSGLGVGQAVSVIPYYNCGKCIACRNGTPNCCSSLRVCGVHEDGGMVEYLSVPEYALIAEAGLSLDALALLEPLAIGAHGIRRASVRAGEFVLVVGAGPIGLGAMEFARIAGANVIALDLVDSRLQFCKEKIGVHHCVNGRSENAKEQLLEITSGNMPTVVIDATGSLAAINGSFEFMAHGARYVLIGLQKGNISFSHPEFHKREATLMSSRNATREDFNHVIDSIKSGLTNPANYITHRAAFGDVKNEFPGWLNPANGVIKAMVEVDL